MSKEKPIDAVVLWVDGSDPEWRKEKAKYEGSFCETSIDDCRFREWGLFKYWFRCIEENLPWIRMVHLVTNGQRPVFINTSHEKLHMVKHSDIMSEEYLPTFSSRAIEMNIHRIEGLSEHFIYFNDDMYVMQPMRENDFFKKELPLYEGLEAIPRATNPEDTYFHSVYNSISVINKNFRKRDVLKHNFFKFYNLKYGFDVFRNIALLPWDTFPCFTNRHLPIPFLKGFFREVWEAEPELCKLTSSHRFKDYSDLNQYVFRYWGIASGKFYPIHTDGQAYHLASADIHTVIDEIQKGKHKMLCINDGKGIVDFESKTRRIVEAFEKRFPKKSSFEK